jgi:broad specificity phosphatase PhoE
MSQLTLVRHGQAATFTEDSDRLTELGTRQGEILGAHWVSRAVKWDAVYVGALRRHAQTETAVASAYKNAGLPWPEAQVLPGWNEYDANAILGTLGQALAAQDPTFAALVTDFRDHATSADRNRYFQRMFEALMAKWVSGEATATGVEAFADFHARVTSAFAQVRAAATNQNIAVFTSGGPIGVCVQSVLSAPQPSAMLLNSRVRNASLTDFTFSRDRISLDVFNATPHLEGELLTYR